MEVLQGFLRKNTVVFDVDPPRELVKAARKKMKQDRDGGADGVEDEGEGILIMFLCKLGLIIGTNAVFVRAGMLRHTHFINNPRGVEFPLQISNP